MTDQVPVIHGKVVSQEDKADFDSLRAILDPKAGLDRLDSYGKWLFASAAIVGSLGAGLSNTALSKLHGLGVWLFALAVVVFGCSLVAASRSLAPHWVEAQRSDLESLRIAVSKQFKSRRRQLAWASGLFAIALGLAAVSPLVSLMTSNSAPVLHYSVDEKGTLDAGLEANALDPGTVIELRLDPPTGSTIQLPRAAASADENGQVKLSLRMTGFSSSVTNMDLVTCAKKRNQTACAEQQRFPVRR